MKELNSKEIEQVSGGNPILAYLVVRYVAQKAVVAFARGVTAGTIAVAKEKIEEKDE